MTAKPETMSAKAYCEALDTLKLSPYAAADILGISLSASHRYAAAGGAPLPVAKLLELLRRHGIPKAWR